MGVFNFGKYKGIIISIALFLILDASVLSLNYYISYQIADDAKTVNLAARQRMLVQRMLTDLFDIQNANLYLLEEDMLASVEELKQTIVLFDSTLTAFTEGAETTGLDGQPVWITRADSAIGQQSLAQASTLWLPYKQHLTALLDTHIEGYVEVMALSQAITYGKENNAALLEKMNKLSMELEDIANAKAMSLRNIQLGGISLAVINFLIIMFHFMRKLTESDDIIDASRAETKQILDTVNEGLFLLDEHQHIGNQHSLELLEILGQEDVAGKSFNALLANMVSRKDLETAQDFVDSLFNPRVLPELIQDLNPLEEVQVNIADEQGQFITKYLSFNFARVMQGKTIQHVLVSVSDITATVLLAQQLEQAKAHGEEQIEMLTSILHTNAELLGEFLANAFSSFDNINNSLKTPAKNRAALNQKNQEIFREIHSFKGEASALELHSFASLAHSFEEELQLLMHKPNLDGNDFLALTVKLDDMISYSQSIQQLNNRLSEFSTFNQESNSN
ncbi:MAG: type IV pili methyl-accepting chemotaxis transducer N-terminal domain-containing protein, partial [Pseudomonadales bacterium]|nr:type IV pili methyl-accepting chemotaxis transducer N-terminal domain-containing protein [Pseudomonadales bacterium]